MVGEKIKKLRIEKDLLQKVLAQQLNLSQQTISLYEAGKREPDYETLEKIADFFNVSTDYLLGRTNIKNIEESEGVQLAKQGHEFENPEEALRFILEQPAMMAYGGYDLSSMPEEEVLEIANDILLTLRISIERRKNKNK